MGITYDSGSNVITLDDDPGAGDSWNDAYDMEDVLTACSSVVTKQGENAYNIAARLKFLDGVYFVSKSEFVELKSPAVTPDYVFQIHNGAHVRFGEYDVTDEFSYNGCCWKIYTDTSKDNIGQSPLPGNMINGEFLCYSSQFWTDSNNYKKGIHFKANAKIRFFDSVLRMSNYYWCPDMDFQDMKVYGGVGAYDMLLATGTPNHKWANLTTMNCNYGVFFSSSTTSAVDLYYPKLIKTNVYDVAVSSNCNWLIRIINPFSNPVVLSEGSGKPGCQVCYTFNVKVTGTSGTPIENALVELKDNIDVNSFAEDTTIDGVLTDDQIVKTHWYRHADMGGDTVYNDYTLVVRKKGFETYTHQFTLNKEINWEVKLTRSKINIDQGVL